MIQYADAQVRRSFCGSFSNVAAHLWPLYLLLFSTLYIKYQLQFSSLPISCFYWIWLLFFLWYLFYCTSILPLVEEVERGCQKKYLYIQTTWALCWFLCYSEHAWTVSFPFASKSIYLEEKKKNELISLFKAYVCLKWEDSSSDNNMDL